MAILRRVTHAAEGRAEALLVVSLVVVVLQVAGVIWWMDAFERGHSQAEHLAISPFRTTLAFVLCGAVGVVCGIPAARQRRAVLVLLGWIAVVVNGLFLLWCLFTSM